jgi:hypothetical protein
MTSIAGNPDARYQDRLLLSFALGQFYLDQSDGGEAFHWLEMGNRLKRSTIHYEWEADRRRFAEIMAIFSPETMSRLGGVGDSSTRPIFVFGMPRSGTSLVEQVLASHPMVFGMGEPIYLAEMAEAPGFLERIPELLPTELASLGRRYLALTSTDSVETPRLVDKMPWNFLYAGLISLILPGARMIHCRRDPLDTCLSCYSLLFSRGYEYAYDQTELGRFYRLYESLMAHWQKVLPTKAVLEVAYEKLVEDTEFEVRRILDFCSLPWDEACLRFYQTPRRVASASLNQVRSPIYRTSVGRAQQFIPWLKPLEAALGLGLQGQ